MQVATVAMDLAKDVFERAFADALEHGDNALPTALHGLLQQLDALESMMVRIEAQLSSFAKQDAASRVGWVERSDTHQQATAELPRLCAGYFLCRTAPLVARTAKPARRASAAGASQESNQKKLFNAETNLPSEKWSVFFYEASCLIEKRRTSCAPPFGSTKEYQQHCDGHFDGTITFVSLSGIDCSKLCTIQPDLVSICTSSTASRRSKAAGADTAITTVVRCGVVR